MKTFARSDRVAGQIQKTLSELLRKDIKDPRLEMVSITGVEVSADLKHARVYFISHGGEGRKQEAADGFKTALGYLKRELAPRLGLRYMPELRFFYDNSFDYGSRIDSILRSLKSDDDSDSTEIEK